MDSPEKQPKAYLKHCLLAASSCAAVLFGFILVKPSQTESILHHTGYWFIAGATAIFAVELTRLLFNCSAQFIRSRFQIATVVGTAILAVFVFTRQDAEYRVLMDEPNLAAAAAAMHLDRTCSMIEPSFGDLSGLPVLDKRPFFFPFLVSVAHDILGFDPSNPFRLNLVFTGLLFWVAFQLGWTITRNRYAAAAGTLLLAFHPLTVHYSSSGGFEILNVLMISLTSLLAIRYYSAPTANHLNLLLLSAVLLSQTRYESVIYLFATGAIILLRFVRDRRLVITWPTIIAPLLLLPIAWQNAYIRSNPHFWDMPDNSIPVFGWPNVLRNLRSARAFFLNPEQNWPSSVTFTIIALAAIAGLVFVIVARRKRFQSYCGDAFWPIIAFGGASLAGFALLMLYYWADLSEPSASRLALPSLLAISVLAAGLCGAVGVKRTRFPKYAVAFAGLSLFWTLPALSGSHYEFNSAQYRRFQWCRAAIPNPNLDRILVIDGFAKIWTSFGLNSIANARAIIGAERLQFHQRSRTYDEIYVVQTFHQEVKDRSLALALNPGNDLGPAFKLEEVDSLSFQPYNVTRLSRLVEIDLDAIKAEGGMDSYFQKYGAETYVSFQKITTTAWEEWQRSLP